MIEGARLLSECGSQSHPGFESLRLRQKMPDNSMAECHPYKVEVVGSNPTLATTIGEWRSLVAHRFWEPRAAGSNPVSPTI